ncbi:MAG: hypothetical protein Q9227_004796 [Pyrenula ochraceoflavens]
MPRRKRPLAEKDANSQPYPSKTKSKRTTSLNKVSPKIICWGNHGHEKEHPPLPLSIAKRFEERRPDQPSVYLRTYPDLEVRELKELLSERGLHLSGKKGVLIERLEAWDEEHLKNEKKVGDDHKEALARQPVNIGAKAEEIGPKDEDAFLRMAKSGPNGPPVYDELGFELDYDHCFPQNRKMRGKGEPTHDDEERERYNRKKKQAMGTTNYKESAWMLNAFRDRISKDLGIPYHTVGREEFEEWQKRGFTVKPEEIDTNKMPETEEERIKLLMLGSAFRKGAKTNF